MGNRVRCGPRVQRSSAATRPGGGALRVDRAGDVVCGELRTLRRASSRAFRQRGARWSRRTGRASWPWRTWGRGGWRRASRQSRRACATVSAGARASGRNATGPGGIMAVRLIIQTRSAEGKGAELAKAYPPRLLEVQQGARLRAVRGLPERPRPRQIRPSRALERCRGARRPLQAATRRDRPWTRRCVPASPASAKTTSTTGRGRAFSVQRSAISNQRSAVSLSAVTRLAAGVAQRASSSASPVQLSVRSSAVAPRISLAISRSQWQRPGRVRVGNELSASLPALNALQPHSLHRALPGDCRGAEPFCR